LGWSVSRVLLESDGRSFLTVRISLVILDDDVDVFFFFYHYSPSLTTRSHLVNIPNALHKTGSQLDKYVPNPNQNSPTAIKMFEFMGKLMGASLRHNFTLPFDLPGLVWKLLVDDRATIDDLDAIDHYASRVLRDILNCKEDLDIVSDEAFEANFSELVWTTSSSNGSEIELVSGGTKRRVRFEERGEYVDRVTRFRLHEFDTQVAAMKRGIATVVPLRSLSLFTWQQLEIRVAGRPDIDSDLLKAHTVYEGYKKDDPEIARFWKIFRDVLTNDERSKFLRFVWGRSRLPTSTDWKRPFKITKIPLTRADDLPMAHTCFFSVDLPPYPDEKSMKRALLICCHHGVGGILNM